MVVEQFTYDVDAGFDRRSCTAVTVAAGGDTVVSSSGDTGASACNTVAAAAGPDSIMHIACPIVVEQSTYDVGAGFDRRSCTTVTVVVECWVVASV